MSEASVQELFTPLKISADATSVMLTILRRKCLKLITIFVRSHPDRSTQFSLEAANLRGIENKTVSERFLFLLNAAATIHCKIRAVRMKHVNHVPRCENAALQIALSGEREFPHGYDYIIPFRVR